jgi:hypothetical protein
MNTIEHILKVRPSTTVLGEKLTLKTYEKPIQNETIIELDTRDTF